jgi:outer membrane lipoprotein-sorting protein
MRHVRLSPSGCEDGWPQRATPTKCLLCVILLLFAACRAQNESATNAPAETVVSSTPPFQTKEPDRYRTTRIITIVTATGKTEVTKTSIAKDGEMRRNESDNVAYLDVPDGRFVLLPADKVYADLATETHVEGGEDEEISPERLLHGDATNTSYQKIGSELIHGRNANKYRIVVNSSTSANVPVSETLIWIDESLNMPIRSETTSADGTKITIELSEVSLDVDRHVFQVPVDYQKIAFSELRLKRQPRH